MPRPRLTALRRLIRLTRPRLTAFRRLTRLTRPRARSLLTASKGNPLAIADLYASQRDRAGRSHPVLVPTSPLAAPDPDDEIDCLGLLS